MLQIVSIYFLPELLEFGTPEYQDRHTHYNIVEISLWSLTDYCGSIYSKVDEMNGSHGPLKTIILQ